MIAIKTWFLEKNEIKGFYGKELTVVRETEKAILINADINGRTYAQWFPKSVVIDEWEKDVSNFGYHDYLTKLDNERFSHQLTTKELMEKLTTKGIKFMNRNEWNNR